MKRLFFTFITCLMLYTGNCMGQADMVSALALNDDRSTLFGLGYEHTFPSKIGLEVNLGYTWKYDLFRPIFYKGYKYNHWDSRISGKYYFLFAQKRAGEGFFCSAMAGFGLWSAIDKKSLSKDRGGRYFGGIGIGGNYFLGDNLFIGGEVGWNWGETKFEFFSPSGLLNSSRKHWGQSYLLFLKAGWKFD